MNTKEINALVNSDKDIIGLATWGINKGFDLNHVAAIVRKKYSLPCKIEDLAAALDKRFA